MAALLLRRVFPLMLFLWSLPVGLALGVPGCELAT